MNFVNIKKMFILYAKKFDLKDKNIMRKFHHSFRVMEYSKEIAESINLSSSDVQLATIIGLLHDIARFSQWTKYKTYRDSISIDHGTLGADILENMLVNVKDKDIILTAVKNHNKLEIESELDERTLLFCKIIRDADKLDILREQGLILKDPIENINEKAIECIYQKKLFDDKYYLQESDHIFRMLTFIYDFNFKYSYNFILKNNIIENKINLLESYSNEIEELENVKKELLNYIYKKIEVEDEIC